MPDPNQTAPTASIGFSPEESIKGPNQDLENLSSGMQQLLLENYIGEYHSFCLDKYLIAQLSALTLQQGSSMNSILLTAFYVLMFRHGYQETSMISSFLVKKEEDTTNPQDNNHSYAKEIVLSDQMDGNKGFDIFLGEIGNFLQEAQTSRQQHTNQKTESSPKAIFILQETSTPFVLDQGLIDFFKKAASNQAFIMLLQYTQDELGDKVCYQTQTYQKESEGIIYAHYIQILSSIVENPQTAIGAIKMLSPNEEDALFLQFNNTLTPYSSHKTLVDLLEEQVSKTALKPALQVGPDSMSYTELNEKSNRLAHYLIQKGVKRGDNIGLLVARGFDMITGMFAILKAGAAYVPIDPDYPLDRQQYILKQSSVGLVIADANYEIKHSIDNNLFLEIKDVDLNNYSNSNPGIRVDSKELAYTIYTSGSTGRPKGVMIEHHSVINLIEWVNDTFKVTKDDRLLFITSMCFDLSVYDIFGTLAAGGCVVIAKKEDVQNVRKLQEMLMDNSISFWDSVPTTMDYLIRELETSQRPYKQTALKTVFLSGDWIPVDLPERIKKYFPNTKVISLGGATEGTIWSNFFMVEKTQRDWKSIPYGRPLQNNFFYILNEQLQPVPVGVVGELYIGGVGVARGYANDKEKTDYSFVKDPFNSKAGGRMYRTGDLGRMLPDLNMEFMGRKDDQVKIRGFRVELGEIESVLNQSNLIRQAIVLAKNDQEGKKRLIGYVIANTNQTFKKDEVVGYLKTKLPEYMIPAAWVQLDYLPLTSNGKIDKKALSEIEPTEQDSDKYIAPQNELEEKFVKIWEEVLGIKKIGVRDNFFELGGHSLIAVQIMTKIEMNTGKNLPLALFFTHPTIEQQVSSIHKNESDSSWRSLVTIKGNGSKMPLYIVHGDGLNVLNFSTLALYVDPEQPIYGLQARGLDGVVEPLDDITEIARHYVNEILEKNPTGPYAIAGYSFGGYVAVEMRKLFEEMGKDVKMLAIFDTNALGAFYNKELSKKIFKKIIRQLPKFFWFTKLFFKAPKTTLNYQFIVLKRRLQAAGFLREPKATGIYDQLNKVNAKHQIAFKKYSLTPFNDRLFLFRCKTRLYFIDEPKYLGWKEYALKGITTYDVPGDHKSMFELPHVKEFAKILQDALNQSMIS